MAYSQCSSPSGLKTRSNSYHESRRRERYKGNGLNPTRKHQVFSLYLEKESQPRAWGDSKRT